VAIKLHRCSGLWVKVGGHHCWRVQKALDEQGIEYELNPFRPGAESATRSSASAGNGGTP
jgi:hypothetical protein